MLKRVVKKVNKWVKICKKWSQGDLRFAKNQSGSCQKAVIKIFRKTRLNLNNS